MVYLRPNSETFIAAQTACHFEQPQVAEEGHGLLPVAGYVEADHAAAPVCLPLHQFVLRGGRGTNHSAQRYSGGCI